MCLIMWMVDTIMHEAGESATSWHSWQWPPKAPNTLAYFFFCLPFSSSLFPISGRQISVMPYPAALTCQRAPSPLSPGGLVQPLLLAKFISLLALTLSGWIPHVNPLILLGKGLWQHCHLNSYYFNFRKQPSYQIHFSLSPFSPKPCQFYS